MEVTVRSGALHTQAEIEHSELFKRWVLRIGPQWSGKVWITGTQAWKDHRNIDQIQIIQGFAQASDDPWPKSFTLLAPTVDVLVTVKSGWRSWVIFVKQFRPAVGHWVYSNVAGFCNFGEAFWEVAKKECLEELGLDDLGDYTLSRLLDNPVFSSPGLTNEEAHFFKLVLRVPRGEAKAFLRKFHNKQTGIAAEGEVLRVRVVPARKAWRFIANQLPACDEKTLHSLALAGLGR